MSRHKEIFKECYPLLADNIDNPNWSAIAQAMPAILGNYEGNDNILAGEILLAITGHLERIHAHGKQHEKV